MGGGLRLGSGADLTGRGVRTGGALSGIVVRQIKRKNAWNPFDNHKFYLSSIKEVSNVGVCIFYD